MSRISLQLVAVFTALAVMLPCPCGDGPAEDSPETKEEHSCCSSPFAEDAAEGAADRDDSGEHDEDACPHCRDDDYVGTESGVELANVALPAPLSPPALTRLLWAWSISIPKLDGHPREARAGPPPDTIIAYISGDLLQRVSVMRC